MHLTSYILVFFEHDKGVVIYEIVCQEDGSFKQPDVWPRCLASKLVSYSSTILSFLNLFHSILFLKL